MDVDRESEREESIRCRVAGLSKQNQKAYYRAFGTALKDPDTYAVLNYIFVCGLHHFYLGRWVRGGVNLAVFVVGMVCLVLGVWWLGLGLILLITLVELPALFLSQSIVRCFNNDLSESLLASYDFDK